MDTPKNGSELLDNYEKRYEEMKKFAYWWRDLAIRSQEVLRKVCLKYCLTDVDDELVPYGYAPLTSGEDDLLKEVLGVLSIKEGDPEYRVWSHSIDD